MPHSAINDDGFVLLLLRKSKIGGYTLLRRVICINYIYNDINRLVRIDIFFRLICTEHFESSQKIAMPRGVLSLENKHPKNIATIGKKAEAA